MTIRNRVTLYTISATLWVFRRDRRHATLGVLVLALGACDVAPAPSSMGVAVEDGVSRRDSAGIEIVTTSRPAHEAAGITTRSVSTSPSLEIGTTSGEEPYQFVAIGQVLRAPDGSIVVTERQTMDIRVFDRDGRHRVSFGGAGEGPARFRVVPRIALSQDQTLVAIDPISRRVTRFALSGEIRQEDPIDGAAFRLPEGVRGSSRALTRSWTLIEGDLWAVRDDALGIPTRPLGTIWADTVWITLIRIGEEHDQVVVGEFRGRRAVPVPNGVFVSPFHSGPIVLGGTSTGDLVTVATDRWEVREYGGDGRAKRISRLAVPRAPLDETVLEPWRTMLRGRGSTRGLDSEPVLQALNALATPDSVPAVSSAYSDNAGNVYLEAWRPAWEAGSRTLRAVRADGTWTSPITVPADLGQIMAVDENGLFVVWYDQFDVPYVRYHTFSSR